LTSFKMEISFAPNFKAPSCAGWGRCYKVCYFWVELRELFVDFDFSFLNSILMPCCRQSLVLITTLVVWLGTILKGEI
jgi:hypothetical protein